MTYESRRDADRAHDRRMRQAFGAAMIADAVSFLALYWLLGISPIVGLVPLFVVAPLAWLASYLWLDRARDAIALAAYRLRGRF